MKKMILAAVLLSSAMASASNTAICTCKRASETDTTGPFFLTLIYADTKGTVRDLMMGAYPSLETCKVQAERMAKMGRCQVKTL